MTFQHGTKSKAALQCASLVINTTTDRWVIPYSCNVFKAVLVEQNIGACDLRFSSDSQCHEFIKRVLLLATEDECCMQAPSDLAHLARDLISVQNR